MQEQEGRRGDREERSPQQDREKSRTEEQKWEEGIGRGEEFGREGERERAQADMYGQEQQRSAGPRGDKEREEPPQGWYGRQRPPTPENFPRAGAPRSGKEGSQRGEEYQGTHGGYEQGHRGGYEKGYRGGQSGYEQDYEQMRPGHRQGGHAQTFGGPGYQEESGREGSGRGERGHLWGQQQGRAAGERAGEEGGRGYRGRGPKNYVRADDRICEEINDLLMASDEVDPSEVEVHVEHGEVILRGTAQSKEEKRRMEDLAGGVLGVQEVLNHLRIRRRDEEGREEWRR